MRKVTIKASSINQEKAINDAKLVLKKAKDLFDVLDGINEEWLSDYGFVEIHEDLLDAIPSLQFDINSGSIGTSSKSEDSASAGIPREFWED